MHVLLLVPALISAAHSAGVPGAVEMAPGIFVLKGTPNQATYSALKEAKIHYVLNLRRDGEGDWNPDAENAAVAAVEVSYIRLAMPRVPPKDDLDLVRSILQGLPPGSRILVHCANGNRAAAAMYVCLVLDRGMDPEKALALAKEAGLSNPETEKAVTTYVNAKIRT